MGKLKKQNASLRAKTLEQRRAYQVLDLCKARKLDVNHPDAIKAAEIIGVQRAVKILQRPTVTTKTKSDDALWRSVGGCFGHGKRR